MTQLRIGEAADLLGVSVDTVRRLVDGGSVEGSRTDGGQRLVDGVSLAAYLVEHADVPREGSAPTRSARNRFTGLVDGIYNHDWFMVAADFDAYAKAQRQVDSIWVDKNAWYSKTVRNTARMGWFSSDRTIAEYARDIWKAETR